MTNSAGRGDGGGSMGGVGALVAVRPPASQPKPGTRGKPQKSKKKSGGGPFDFLFGDDPEAVLEMSPESEARLLQASQPEPQPQPQGHDPTKRRTSVDTGEEEPEDEDEDEDDDEEVEEEEPRGPSRHQGRIDDEESTHYAGATRNPADDPRVMREDPAQDAVDALDEKEPPDDPKESGESKEGSDDKRPGGKRGGVR